MALTRKYGKKAEEKACIYLKKKGYKIVERNWYFHKNEIDIIALDGETLVFVEVKSRSSGDFGMPEDSITFYKKQNIIKSAKGYIMMKRLFDINARFDVVAVFDEKIEHYKSAFTLDI